MLANPFRTCKISFDTFCAGIHPPPVKTNPRRRWFGCSGAMHAPTRGLAISTDVVPYFAHPCSSSGLPRCSRRENVYPRGQSIFGSQPPARRSARSQARTGRVHRGVAAAMSKRFPLAAIRRQHLNSLLCERALAVQSGCSKTHSRARRVARASPVMRSVDLAACTLFCMTLCCRYLIP